MQVSDRVTSPPATAESRVRGGWLLAFAAAILPFLLLAYYNYPSIHDDYSNSNRIIRMGRMEFIRELYATWTGRYTELALKAYLDPLSYQQTTLLARVQPIAVVLLLALGAFCFFRVLLRGARTSVVLACAFLLTVLYLNGFEMAGAALYWFGGYTSYTAGIIASLFAFAGLVGVHRYQGRPGAQLLSLLVAAGFGIVAIGAYDVSMMAICWVLGSAAALAWLLNSPAKWWFTAVFALAMIGTFVAVTAPGNRVRAAMAGRDLGAVLKSPQAIVIMVKSVYFAVTQSVSWANSLLLLLGSLLLAGLLTRVRESVVFNLGRIHPVLLALWLLGGVGAMIFPSILVYQTVWPHSWQCVYFYFMFGFSWLLTSIFARYSAHSVVLGTLASAKAWRLTALAFCALCFLSSTSNTQMALLDVAAKAPEHYARVRQREQYLKDEAKRGARVTEMRPLYSNEDAYKAPSVLYTYDFNNDDAVQYAIYYGVDSVVIKPNPYHP
ncbi:DUF6056 family protein [Hymenobacter chitinivorans]|uniref:Uncharacterized protein n=1 Tax=Hymenobacter chitinivorans DSM 11115 TaxID=1121954 RepID=A0A2M9BM46_9BACT|nr:DUF6056 family protein [Hymenobacter chitinivorans]PJJ58980.1 hypothetical protein CLV45_0393 [Hymenobacter chitinivorans DSM 11115]